MRRISVWLLYRSEQKCAADYPKTLWGEVEGLTSLTPSLSPHHWGERE